MIVFARAPVAGRVKTRLSLGAAPALRLHMKLIEKALGTAREARCGPVELHVTDRHELLRTFEVKVRPQRGAELGERMYNALRHALRRHRRALILGADVPALTPSDLRRAARLLEGTADVVLAPAEDGGYALIGARRISLRVFAGVRWGSAEVLSQTLRNIAGAGMHFRLLRTVWDVDRPEDLARLKARPLSSAFRRGARR